MERSGECCGWCSVIKQWSQAHLSTEMDSSVFMYVPMYQCHKIQFYVREYNIMIHECNVLVPIYSNTSRCLSMELDIERADIASQWTHIMILLIILRYYK